MYLDWQYFLKQGQDFVRENSIKFERVTSGFEKGQYLAKLDIPKDIDFYERNNYLLREFGYDDLPTYSRFSRFDKHLANIRQKG